jgi:hypothetical protein
MELVEHARKELARLREDDALVYAVVEVIKTFEHQKLDSLERNFALAYLNLLLRHKPLTVLTNASDEWVKPEGVGYWRSLRDPEAWSNDGGKTFWLLSEAQTCDPEPPPIYTSADHAQVVFPPTCADAVKLIKSDPTFLEQSAPMPPSGGVSDVEAEG